MSHILLNAAVAVMVAVFFLAYVAVICVMVGEIESGRPAEKGAKRKGRK